MNIETLSTRIRQQYVKRMSTWDVLEEVDELMKDKSGWIPLNWQGMIQKNSTLKNASQRKKDSNILRKKSPQKN